MTSSTRNVKLGVCKIYLGGQDMGFTQGGVEVSVSTDTHVTNIDQFGKTTVNELIQGRNVKVKCPLAETTVRNIVATMPGASLVSNGVQATGTLTFATLAGIIAGTTSFTIGGQAFSFHATTAGLYQIVKAATLALTLQNVADTINRALIYSVAGIPAGNTGGTALNNAAGGIQAIYDSVGAPTVITLKAGDPDTLGNAVTTVAASGAVAGAATLTGGVAETKVRVDVTTGVGVDLLSTAQQLRLHPTSKIDTDFSDDFVVYQAGTAGALTFAYKVDAERIFNIEFNGYPDANGKLFSVGDALA